MNDWAIKLFNKSIVKQVKYKHLINYLGDYAHKYCLDLGSDNGVISYLLRGRGGVWSSADIEDVAIDSMRTILRDEVYKIEETRTPFGDEEFDIIAIIDLLEHITPDREFLREIDRILKKEGLLVINVPHKKKWSVIRLVRSWLGLTDEQHGHVRQGYTLSELKMMLPAGFTIVNHTTYSKVFLELVDMVISFVFHMLSKGRESKKGTLVTEKDLKKYKVLFAVYSFTYPLLYIWSRLDSLLFFMSGYRLIVSVRKK